MYILIKKNPKMKKLKVKYNRISEKSVKKKRHFFNDELSLRGLTTMKKMKKSRKNQGKTRSISVN